jgi:hypothetical protein
MQFSNYSSEIKKLKFLTEISADFSHCTAQQDSAVQPSFLATAQP